MSSGDAERDGLALVECAHRRDWEGARAVLGNCDSQAVAAFLARVAADLVAAWIDPDDPERVLSSMRAHYS